jgi:Domain of unknown function (DUF4386)
MTQPLAETSPSTRGRILAALDLFVMTAGITAQVFIADRLVDYGDASKTAANILANSSLYRLAFTIFMLEMTAQITASVMFYDLLKPVNRSVARVGAVIGLTGCGIKTMARLFFYAPLILLGGASYLAAFPPGEIEALALTLIRINNQGAAIGLIFFGFETLSRGWLLFNSGFLPRALGVLSVTGGLGWLTYLWPPLGAQAYALVALVAIVGTVAMNGWLLIRGVDDLKWRERAAIAATSIWR